MTHDDKSIYLLSVVLSLHELAKAQKLDSAAVLRVTESALKRVGLPSFANQQLTREG